MSNDDSKQKPPASDRTEEQPGFDSGSFGEKERDIAPVFEDFETGTAATIAAAWQAEQLKPELVRETEPELDDDDEEDFEYEPEPPPAPEPAQKWENKSSGNGPWPIGLIAVATAVVALLLISAGGYSVMQQRANMQEEIRSLQAATATSASPKEVAASRDAQRVLTARNKELLNTVDALHMEIRSLRDTTQGLESQLFELKSDKATIAAKPRTKPRAVASAPKRATTSIASGDWFVNFSSYDASATANTWVARLKPAHGEVVAVPTVKNGDTFYRVRVVNLSNEAQARDVAQALAKQYKLPKLWIGQQ